MVIKSPTIALFLLSLLLWGCEAKKDEKTKEPPPPKNTDVQEPLPGEKIDSETAHRIRRDQERAEKETARSLSLNRVYRHSCGVYFLYPDEWKLQEGEAALSLVPPDLAKIEGQAGELFLVLGESAEGISRPDDPGIVRYVSRLVSGLTPFLKKTKEMKIQTLRGRDVGTLTWKGTHPNGTEYRGKIWVTLLNGFGVGLLAVSPSKNFTQREIAIREIFSTLGFKKPTSDPRLFGIWKHEKIYMSGEFSAITVRTMVLNPDGTCREGGKLAASMSHQDSDGNFSGSTSGKSSGGFRYQGKWSTRNKRIFLHWGTDGEETWDYLISGDSLLFKGDGEKKLWKRIR
jgi:hypothetical protein